MVSSVDGLERRFIVIDRVTNEETTLKAVLDEYIKAAEQQHAGGFELSYKEEMCSFIKAADVPAADVLAYLLKSKKSSNVLNVTTRSIVAETGVSKTTVNKVMQKLQKDGLMKKIRNGTYMLLPEISIRGGGSRWLAKDCWHKGVV